MAIDLSVLIVSCLKVLIILCTFNSAQLRAVESYGGESDIGTKAIANSCSLFLLILLLSSSCFLLPFSSFQLKFSYVREHFIRISAGNGLSELETGAR